MERTNKNTAQKNLNDLSPLQYAEFVTQGKTINDLYRVSGATEPIGAMLWVIWSQLRDQGLKSKSKDMKTLTWVGDFYFKLALNAMKNGDKTPQELIRELESKLELA